MKICVFGAGAVGGHVAAKLAAGGHDVSVIARGAHLEAMREQGITLIQGDKTLRGRVRAVADAAALGPQDFVFVTLKANALGAFAEAAAPIVAPQTGVVFGQNGIPWWYGLGLSPERPRPPDLSKLDPGGRLQKMLKPGQIIGGIVYSANEVREPGVIVNHNLPGHNMIVVGRPDDADSPRIAELRAILEKNDLSSPGTSDIRTSVWAKIVQALGTGALCTLTGAAIAVGARQPGPVEARRQARRRSAGDRARARCGTRPRAESPERRPVFRPDRPQAVDAAGL